MIISGKIKQQNNMKKTYIIPEMEVMTVMTTGMLAASSLLMNSNVNVDDVDVLLAPEFTGTDNLDSFFE